AILTRPSFALFVPAALVGWLLSCVPERQSDVRRAAWRGAAPVLAGMVIILSPGGVRDARSYGRFVAPSGWVRGRPCGGLDTRATGASNMSFRDEPEFRTLSEVDQDATLARRALDFARNHPGRVLELAAIKLGRYWSPWLNAEEYQSRVMAVMSAAVVIPI